MKANKNSTKSVDYTSTNIDAIKKADFLSKKQSLISKLKIIDILDRRKANKNLNFSSNRSLEKLEFLNTQQNLQIKSPKNLEHHQFSNKNLIEKIDNNNLNNTNAKDFIRDNFLSENNLNSISNIPLYNVINSVNNNSDFNHARKHSTKKSLNFNSNNNLSNGNNIKNRIETPYEITNNNVNFGSFNMQKNLSTKSVNNCKDSNANKNNSNLNRNYFDSNNRKFIHKKVKSNLNGNFNHNFNLFVKPKICVNIINNNNEVNKNDANENSKMVSSSRRKNTKSVSTDRRFSNSIDFSNGNNIKNNLCRTNIITNKKTNDKNNNYLSNSKQNETENDIKNMIQSELANSLVKGGMGCPMSPQIHKSNLLNKYINTDENSTPKNSGFICSSSNKVLNQNANIGVNPNLSNGKKPSESIFNPTASSKLNGNLSNKKSENFENLKSFNTTKEVQKKNPKESLIKRTYSQIAKGIMSPKDKDKTSNNQNEFSNLNLNNHNANALRDHTVGNAYLHNYNSDKNMHYSNAINNFKNKEKNSTNNNKFYKINYNTKYTNTSKNSNLNANVVEKKFDNAAVDENSIKSKNSKNKISINYLTKPNLRINSACNLNVKNFDNLNVPNNNQGLAQQKGKNKSNNYLSKISKALQMRQSPKEIDKKNFQLEYLVSKPQMNEFNQRIEKNKLNKNQIILSNNLDLMQGNFNNEKFYNEIKTATTLENLNSEDDEEADQIEEEENFNPIHLQLTTEKDYNNCVPYELEENYNHFENLDDKIIQLRINIHQKEKENQINNNDKNKKNILSVSKFEKNLNYLKPDTRVSRDSEDKKIDNEENEKGVIVKCLETTLCSFDNFNLEKEENLDLNYNGEGESKGKYTKIFDFNSQEEISKNYELISDRGNEREGNSVFNLNCSREKKGEVKNNYNRRINSSLFPNSQAGITNGFSVYQGNKFFEKFILEKTDSNKITNDIESGRNNANEESNDHKENKKNDSSVNIYKRKKSVYNFSNNIPLNTNKKEETAFGRTESNLNKELNNTQDCNAKTENLNRYSNKKLIKIESNEVVIFEENQDKNINKHQINNNSKPSNIDIIAKDSINFSHRDSNKLTSGNADSLSDFKRNFSPRNLNLVNKENQKQREYHLSFDTNQYAFQSNKTTFSPNTTNNNNPNKIAQHQRINNKKNDEENNFECPEELHFYYVKTFQKGKNLIVNFD